MECTQDESIRFHEKGDMERYAYARLREWGLDGWTFVWSRGKRQLGSCRFLEKKISLSRHFVEHNLHRADQIRDTILHEIAHALAWEHHRARGHGNWWKHYCGLLGAVPRASAPEHSVDHSPYKYFVRVKGTGEIVGKYYRKPRFARYIKRVTLKNRPELLGKLELVDAYEV